MRVLSKNYLSLKHLKKTNMNCNNANIDCASCGHKHKIYCSLEINDYLQIPDLNKDIVFKKGDVIFKENSYPHAIYALVSGKVKISKTGEEGKEQIVRFASSGDLIGYRALLSGEKYRAGATALTDLKVCIIPKESFLKLLETNKKLSLDLLQTLSKDLRNAENRILSISQKTVRERIAETLVLLYYQFGTSNNQSINIKLTRKEIGNTAGSTIETTIRTLSELKKEGIIEFDGKDIIINDITELIEIANIQN